MRIFCNIFILCYTFHLLLCLLQLVYISACKILVVLMWVCLSVAFLSVLTICHSLFNGLLYKCLCFTFYLFLCSSICPAASSDDAPYIVHLNLCTSITVVSRTPHHLLQYETFLPLPLNSPPINTIYSILNNFKLHYYQN